MTKARDARQDLVSRLRPLERLGTLIGEVDVAPDSSLELPGAAMHTAPQLLLGERREPPLHQIHPGPAGRREVDMKARMPDEPAVNHRGLVCAGVIEDKMNVEIRRHRRVDGAQEFAKLAGPMALMELAHDLA